MKRTYRLFALLMAVLMLFGMLPASYAEGGNQMPGGEFTVGCNHNWDWRYPNGEPKHCQEERLMEMYCTLCGQVASSYPVTGDHTHGSWQWDGTPPANCYEWGIQNEFCSVCGEVFNEREVRGEHQWGGYTTVEPAGCETPGLESKLCTVCGEHGDSREIPALGHDWGDWRWEFEATCQQEGLRVRYCKRCNMREEDYVTGSHQYGNWKVDTEPTCTERGLKYKRCAICGDTQWQYIAPVDHSMGEWRVVEEPQVGLPGYERRFCIYQCGTYEEREIPPLEEALELPGLELTLTLDSTPANGEYFVVGEQVVLTASWSNLSPFELFPFYVSIWPYEQPSRDSQDLPYSCSFDAEEPITSGMTGSHSMVITVTEEDVARGGIYAMAFIWSSVHNGPEVEEVTTPFVTAPCGEDSLSTDGLSLSLSLSSTPANGTHFVVGEEVTFTETWVNNSDQTLYPFSVSIFTCAAPVYGSEVDQICSWFAEDYGGPVAPGATNSHTLTVTVTEADVARGAIYAMAELLSTVQDGPDLENVATPYVTAPCAPTAVGNSTGVRLEKELRNAPANGEYYVPGEVLNYALTLRIDDGLLLDDAAIYDPINGGDGLVISYGKGLYGSMGMDVFYTVTEEDAQRGYVENTAYASWLYSDSGEAGYCESETVTTPCGSDNSGDSGPVDGLTVTKSVTSTPANGAYYVPGEDIHFLITVNNDTGKELDVIVLTDPLSASFYHEIEAVPAGESVSRSLSYTVTEFDAEIGNITNYAYAVAYIGGEPHSMTSNSVTVPCNFLDTDGDGEPDEPYGIHTWLDVTKEVESLPMNGQFYVEGETVAYKITYTNAGESVLMDVRIYDALVGMAEIATAEYMEPGDSRVCYLNYTVTAEDTQRGYITNTAIGQYVMHGYVNTFYSNEVTVQTNNFKYVTITPGSPEDPGTIEPGKLPLGESSCVRTITGKDNASASYETTFCADHVATQSSVMLMTQAATTPEAQVQAATYAATLWCTEAEKLYQQLLDAADNQGKITVMTEYIRFAAMATNYEIVLKNIYPDQPALVAQLIAKLWEDKCVTLCYEIHTAADVRTDSLLSVTATTGAAADCACTVTAETAGAKAYTQSFCAAHAFPFSMIDMLLQGQDTFDSWATVRQIWMVELNGAYNKVNTLLAGNSDLALAEFNATMQWLEAREAYLNALYPDNPELVAQIMVKHIMDRVNDLCPALK